LRGVRRALLDADVNVAVADTLIEGVKKRSLGKEVLDGVTPEQQFVYALNQELRELMGGGEASKASVNKPAATLAFNPDKPTVVLLAG
jgi:signal recognition particle subunit SRP54